jgi:formate--tetrahydrofolate ligase
LPTKLLPIETIASKLNLPPELYEKRSPVSAKLSLDLLDDPRLTRAGKLILVTATTPTVFGEGKTVTSIGLAQGLEKIGKRAIVCSREPSLGPVFGMKGGAAGGGRSQVEPAEKINLHFHGDFHAIASAHNLLAALIDAHLFHGNELDLDPSGITWPRTLDMNDRALRKITLSVTEGRQRDGSNRPSGFLITAASEIMAILALAANRADLRTRLARIVVGQNRSGQPVRAVDLQATGPMMALLSAW